MICQEGKIGVAAVDGTYKADNLIPSELKQQFLDQVAVLEADSFSETMWHPDSNEQVLDLVHPSMHCFVAGKTRVYSTREVDYMSWYDFSSADNAKILSSEEYIRYASSK